MEEIGTAPRGGTLRAFVAFLRRPQVLVPSGLGAPGAHRALAAMVALHIGVLLVVMLPLVYFWQSSFDLPMPDAFGKVPQEWLLPITVLAAPLLEEMLFRGWQTGRVRALWLLACAVAFGVLLAASTMGLSPLATGIALLVLILAAPLGWFPLRKRGTPRWYAAAYPATFYLVVAGFAAAHILNYPSFSLLALPLVLPQLWGALVLGFVRMRIGLTASILAHAFANAAALGVASLAVSAAT